MHLYNDLTLTNYRQIPVCELAACVGPAPQAAAGPLYCCTIHPKHHMIAMADLSLTQIQ